MIYVRKKSLDDYKKDAPEIPPNTCPYIDFAEQVLKELKEETDEYFTEQRLILVESFLEYVRESNDSLRKNSHYWYTKFNNLYHKK